MSIQNIYQLILCGCVISKWIDLASSVKKGIYHWSSSMPIYEGIKHSLRVHFITFVPMRRDRSECYYFMPWYTHLSFMMMSIVNGVCKGTSFLPAKLRAPGLDEMTMWWLSACCCHFSHDFLMLFSHGSPPRNDKQMPNAFYGCDFPPLVRSRSHTLLYS